MTVRGLVRPQVRGVVRGVVGRGGAAQAAPRGVVFDGDSITQGGSSNPTYPDRFRTITGLYRVNLGVATRRLQAMSDTYAARGVGAHFNADTCDTLVILGGINDISQVSTSSATLNTVIRTYCAQARASGYRVFVGTVMPYTGLSGPQEATRIAHNANLRANWPSFADGLIDYATTVGLINPANTTYYADGLHPNGTGSGVMAEAARVALSAPSISTEEAPAATTWHSTPLIGTATLSGSDLRAETTAAPTTVRANRRVAPGRARYFEIEIDASGADGDSFLIGAATSGSGLPGLGLDANLSIGLRKDGSILRNGGSIGSAPRALVAGDIVGVAIKNDGSNLGKIWWTLDGTTYFDGSSTYTKAQVEAFAGGADITTLLAKGGGWVYPAVASVASSGHRFDGNFGAAALAYTKPTGFITFDVFPIERIVNGEFDALDGWTYNPSYASVSGGVLTMLSPIGMTQVLSVERDRPYVLTITGAAGNVAPLVHLSGLYGASVLPSSSATGTKVYNVIADADTMTIGLVTNYGSTGGNCTFSSVSLVG